MTSKLKLLGQFELTTENDKPVKITSKNGQLILAMLALEADLCITREKLIGNLWATRSEQQARNSLRQMLSNLRKTFNDKRLEFFKTDYTCVRLLGDQIDIDVLQIPDSIHELTESELESLAMLYRGEFLENLILRDASIQNWLETQRQFFNQQRNKILSKLVELYYRHADYEKMICTGQQLLDIDPLNETIHRFMIQAFSAIGDRVAASKQYQHCAQLLETELDISPSKKTTDVYTGACKNSFEGRHLYSCKQQYSVNECSDKPAIAILPFKNIDQCSGQDSLCIGLTEDITTHLSRFRDLLVITSSSTFFYKDSKMKAQDIAEKLKVNYVLEGSVQNVENRVRISTQLIDASNGIHLWSEIYDRQIAQTRHLQDDVAQMIVGTLACVYGGRLRKAWQKQSHTHRPVNARAFDYFTRGIDCANACTKSKNKQARHYFEKAVEIDPDYAKAYSCIACTHLLDAVEAWNDDYETCLQNCLHYATKAIDCDDSESWSYWQLAVYFIYTLNHDLALLEFEKAVQLNPNDADVLADVGYYFSYCGNSGKALEYANKAMRLNPHYPDYYLLQLGQIFFDARQYHKAICMFQKSHRTTTALAGLYLAASHAALGQSDESSTALEQVMSIDHNASLKKWTDRRLAPYKFRKDLDHFRHHLQCAGLN